MSGLEFSCSLERITVFKKSGNTFLHSCEVFTSGKNLMKLHVTDAARRTLKCSLLETPKFFCIEKRF